MLCVRRCWMVVGAIVHVKLSAAVGQYRFSESDSDARVVINIDLAAFVRGSKCMGRKIQLAL
jgi:hypothetical protein